MGPPTPRVLAPDWWLGGLPDGVGASSAPKLPKNSKQPPTTRAGRTSIKPLNALASRCKGEGWICFYLLFVVVRSLTLGSARVCAYASVVFGRQTDRQTDTDPQTHRHTGRDTQTEGGRTGKEGRAAGGKKGKRSESEALMEAVGVG